MKIFLALASDPEGYEPEFGSSVPVVAKDKRRALDLLLERFPMTTEEWWYDIEEIDPSVEGVIILDSVR